MWFCKWLVVVILTNSVHCSFYHQQTIKESVFWDIVNISLSIEAKCITCILLLGDYCRYQTI